MCLVCDDGLVFWIQAAGLLTFTVDGFIFSSEEPMLTEISTVTGANNLNVLGL
jgi:hypothetical protein